MMPCRTVIAVIAGLCAHLTVAWAEPDDWPGKPVRILVGFGPGGGTDVVARILANKLTVVLGQQFLVENRPGASGTIAANIVAKAPNDGYTVLAISTAHAVSSVMVKDLPYDPVKSFAPVGILASSAYVVVVSQKSPATDLKSLIAYLHNEPGKLKFATVGEGTGLHLAAADLCQRARVSARHVSYGTTSDVVAALRRGDVAFGLELYHAIRGHPDFGDLQLIAVTTPYRWPAARGVPTVAESGFPDFAYGGWYGLVFPSGTAPSIVDKLHRALEVVLARDDVKADLEGAGAIPALTSPAQLAELIVWDVGNFREVVRRGGLESKAAGQTSPSAGGALSQPAAESPGISK